MKKYIKKSECPEKLQRIISALAFFPLNDDELFEQLRKLELELMSADYDLNIETVKRFEVAFFKLIPEEKLLDYLRDYQPGLTGLNNIYVNFKHLRTANKILNFIAESNAKSHRNPLERHYDFRARVGGFGEMVFLYLDNEGQIRPQIPTLMNVLADRQIDQKQIRKCPICQQIYWAKKITSETCGNKSCVDSLGNRKRLAKIKAEKENISRFKPRKKDNGTL